MRCSSEETKMRTVVIAISACLLAVPASAQKVEHAPPGGPYKKVSELVKLPDFIPGLGTLYVNPGTLPAGPFLAYDLASGQAGKHDLHDPAEGHHGAEDVR
jgi:hypothetical protein